MNRRLRTVARALAALLALAGLSAALAVALALRAERRWTWPASRGPTTAWWCSIARGAPLRYTRV